MYEIILSILIILCFLSLVYFLYENIKLKRKAKNILEEKIKLFRKEKEQEFNKIEEDFNEKIILLKDEFNERNTEYNKIIEQTKTVIKEEEEKKNLILNQKLEMIDKEAESYKKEKYFELKEEFKKKKENINNDLLEYINNTNLSIKEKEEELQKIIKELEDFRNRREAVNEAIIREKEIQEKENFYKINITENDIEDIEILRTIESKLKNKEALNKLIFDVYISKPMKEMTKRVLNGKAPSGIYKITYLPTGESYIGKSTNLKNRWEQHCKSVFGLGTISHSSLHTKMARDGIWNFSFEMLEEVPKENLTEREKYYINFYDTVKFGMNEKVG